MTRSSEKKSLLELNVVKTFHENETDVDRIRNFTGEIGQLSSPHSLKGYSLNWQAAGAAVTVLLLASGVTWCSVELVTGVTAPGIETPLVDNKPPSPSSESADTDFSKDEPSSDPNEGGTDQGGSLFDAVQRWFPWMTPGATLILAWLIGHLTRPRPPIMS